MVEFLRPDADGTIGNWTGEDGRTTNLYTSINESTLNLTNYIQSGTNPSNDKVRIRYGNPAGLITSGKVRYTYGKKNNNSTIVNQRTQLVQGASTIIAFWDHADIPYTPTTVAQDLTGPQLLAITDFNDLWIEHIANPTTGVTKAFGEGRTSYSANVAVNTFAGMLFPNPGPGRICVVPLALFTSWTISSFTIGGVTATERVGTATGPNPEAHIFTAQVDSGTSLDVVVTLDFHDTDTELTVASYSLTGLSSAVPSDTEVFEFGNSNPIVASVTVPTGGAAIAVAMRNSATGGNTWNVGTEDYDPTAGTNASATMGSTSTSGAQALAIANSGALFGVMAAAAWGP